VARIKYDIDMMKYMSMFESLTGAKLKDCIVNDGITFVVQENDMGKAIGKKGSNVRRIESTFKKKIRLIEFNEDVLKFVANLIEPLKVNEITQEEGVVSIRSDNRKTKGMIIGRDKEKINALNGIVKRYFEIEEVKVV